MTAKLIVSSRDFAAGARIPQKHAYKGEGDNVPPAIFWAGAPPGTKEFALICDDPDAPVSEPWVHWIVCRIPWTVKGLPEGLAAAVQGKNTWGENGWGGPLPPVGHGLHHYHFRVYALDANVGVGPGTMKAALLKAMKGHVVAEGELIGTYSR